MSSPKRYRRKLKRKVSLEREIQSLRDHTDDKLCNLGDQVFELENKLFTLALLLGALGVIVFALIIWQIISQFTV